MAVCCRPVRCHTKPNETLFDSIPLRVIQSRVPVPLTPTKTLVAMEHTSPITPRYEVEKIVACPSFKLKKYAYCDSSHIAHDSSNHYAQ